MGRIVLDKVVKRFGDVEVIPPLDLTIEEGEFTVFVGPSGCGKSTLLRLIAGLEDVSDGAIHIDGQDATALPPAQRRLAMVFQSYALYPHMTVFHNMAFSLSLQGLPKSEIQERVEVAAKILQMEHLLDRRPAALSGGQRQRVAIGRAIVRNPEVFLFDEPLSNLDAALRHDTRVEIAKLHNQLGATTIYVTHDQVEAMTLADKIVVLKDGVVMQVGAPMDLFNDPGNEFVASFLGSPKMNFFGGKLTGLSESGETAGFEGVGISVDAVRLVSSNKKAGDEARLGIRPQHLRLDDNGQLKGKITLVECLGTETVVELFDSEGKMFRFASPDALSLSVEQEVAFSFDQTKAHLF